MNTIFMNSKYTKTSDPHRLLLSFTNKIDLRRKDKYIALPNLSNYYTLLCLIVGVEGGAWGGGGVE